MKPGDRVVIVNTDTSLDGMNGTVKRLRPRPTSADAVDVLLDHNVGATMFQPYEVELIEEDDS